MAAAALFAKNPSPSDADIDAAMANLCRRIARIAHRGKWGLDFAKWMLRRPPSRTIAPNDRRC